ncbi:hypothetical protein BVRB_4g081810 [Beta vulgaris subsp. vulgaris]|nr:hypothetical protein BVRB_4g081810 [Beta vulgaris subsp. vulgaris]
MPCLTCFIQLFGLVPLFMSSCHIPDPKRQHPLEKYYKIAIVE